MNDPLAERYYNIIKEKVKEEVLVLAEDKTFENEIKKPEVKSETRETKSETTSSLTFGE